MRLLICILTFNRPEMLACLLDDIEREGAAGGDLSIAARVYDDHSAAFETVRLIVMQYPWSVLVPRSEHGGKRMFWALMNRLLLDARRASWDRLLVLPDDVRLAPGFFMRLEAAWSAVPSHAKLLINPLMDARGPAAQWTSFEPVFVDRGPGLYRVGWNDGCWYSGRRLVERFGGFRRPSSMRWRRAYISTGVGSQLSRWAVEQGFTLWQVADSLLWHGDHRSKMHAEHPTQRQREL